ncbi:MAG: DsbE family thiol:disulfide interchange protein [Pseudomonadota bacterium]
MSPLQRILVFAPFAVLIALVAVFALQLDDDPSILPSALIDQPVPAFSLDVLGSETGVDQTLFAAGDVTLINVFASWCQPCWAEHSVVADLAKNGVNIVGWAYKDTPEAIAGFLEDLGNPYSHVVLDEDGQAAINLGVYGAPETYVVDRAGVIRHRHVGALTPDIVREQLRPLIESLSS